MTKSIIHYKIIYTVLFLASMQPWFLLGINQYYLFAVLLVYQFAVFRKELFKNQLITVPSVLLLIFVLWMAKGKNIVGHIAYLMDWGLMVCYLGLNNEMKDDIIKTITKVLSVILGISSVAYVLNMTGIVSLPGEPFGNDLGGIMNFKLYMISIYDMRFMGPFIEPGYLALGTIPILALNDFDFKNKFLWPILFSLVISFSLAGYVCLFILLIFKIVNSRDRQLLKNTLIIAALVGVVLYAVPHILGNTILDDLIWSRLEWDGETITGNNRTSASFDSFYEQVMNSNDKWVGRTWDAKTMESDNSGSAGYKMFIGTNGIIGLILFFLAYGSVFYNSNYTFRKLQLFILLIIQLIPTAYPMAWCMLLTLFSLDITDKYYDAA